MRKIALILCAALLVGILAGCGNKELDAPWEFDLESHWQVDENGEIVNKKEHNGNPSCYRCGVKFSNYPYSYGWTQLSMWYGSNNCEKIYDRDGALQYTNVTEYKRDDQGRLLSEIRYSNDEKAHEIFYEIDANGESQMVEAIYYGREVIDPYSTYHYVYGLNEEPSYCYAYDVDGVLREENVDYDVPDTVGEHLRQEKYRYAADGTLLTHSSTYEQLVEYNGDIVTSYAYQLTDGELTGEEIYKASKYTVYLAEEWELLLDEQVIRKIEHSSEYADEYTYYDLEGNLLENYEP